jgi:hypothetical protein
VSVKLVLIADKARIAAIVGETQSENRDAKEYAKEALATAKKVARKAYPKEERILLCRQNLMLYISTLKAACPRQTDLLRYLRGLDGIAGKKCLTLKDHCCLDPVTTHEARTATTCGRNSVQTVPLRSLLINHCFQLDEIPRASTKHLFFQDNL